MFCAQQLTANQNGQRDIPGRAGPSGARALLGRGRRIVCVGIWVGDEILEIQSFFLFLHAVSTFSVHGSRMTQAALEALAVEMSKINALHTSTLDCSCPGRPRTWSHSCPTRTPITITSKRLRGNAFRALIENVSRFSFPRVHHQLRRHNAAVSTLRQLLTAGKLCSCRRVYLEHRTKHRQLIP